MIFKKEIAKKIIVIASETKQSIILQIASSLCSSQ
jgi:hypothetical protein